MEGGRGRKGDKEKAVFVSHSHCNINYFIQKNYLPNMYVYIWEAIHIDCIMMC